jgi:hypothetical protein
LTGHDGDDLSRQGWNDSRSSLARPVVQAGADEVIFSFPFADTAGIAAVGQAFAVGGQ